MNDSVGEGMLTQRFSRVERRVMKDALDCYKDALLAKGKQLKTLGISTEEIDERIATITGGNGLGKGIIERLSEQMSIAETEQMTIDDESKQLQVEALATATLIIAMPDMPAGNYLDQLVRLVNTWAPDRRTVVRQAAKIIADLPEGEEFDGTLPSEIPYVIDRAIEWTMSDEELQHFLEHGPWDLAWEKPETDGVVLWYAEREGAGNLEGQKIVDPARFDTEDAGKRCVARLNRLATMLDAAAPADATEAEDEVEDEEQQDETDEDGE